MKPKLKKIAKDTGFSASDFITSDNKLKLKGEADPGSKIVIYIDGVKVGTAKADKNGKWKFKTKKLADGDYAFSFKSKKGGKTKKSKKDQKVVVDTDTDTPVIASLADDTGIAGDRLTSDNTLALGGTAEAGATVEVFNGATLLETVVATAAGLWSFVTSSLADGVYSFTTRATDAAGNTKTSAVFAATVDTAPPAKPTIDGFANDTGALDGTRTSDNTLLLWGEAEAGAMVEVFDGADSVGTAEANVSGQWFLETDALPEGARSLTAKATDAAGNTSAASTALAVTIDTSEPAPSVPDLVVLSDTGVSNMDNITKDTTPTFTGTAAAGTTLRLFADGDEVGSGVADGGGAWSITSSALLAGTYDITVTATDDLGNTSTASAALAVTIKVHTPITSFLTITDPDGFKIIGEDANDYAGWSVSSAGDFNNDGFGDFIIGAVGDADHGDQTGAAYVVYGAANLTTIDLGAIEDNTDTTDGFKIIGDGDGSPLNDSAGYSVSSAGDFNNDGFDDIMVAAIGNDDGGNNAGAVFVIYGSAGPQTNIDLSTQTLDGTDGFQIIGQTVADSVGFSISSAGDVNDDGLDDIILGAPYNVEDAAPQQGAAYVLFGTATTSTPAVVDLDSLGALGFKIIGESSLDQAGFSVSSAGDVDGDGVGDLIIGANNADSGSRGAAYVVLGSDTIGTVDLTDIANGVGGFKILSDGTSGDTGFSMSSAGDVNNDGFDDVIVGNPLDALGGNDAGAAYVVFGSATPGEVDLINLSAGVGGFKIFGESAGDEVGHSVSSAGDINGDGFDDVIVGSEDIDAAYVVYGRAAPGLLNLDNVAAGIGGFKIEGAASNSVSLAGDVNNDGFNDLVFGDSSDADGGAAAGAAFVIYG